MKAIQFSLFVSLLLVGCREEETEFERTKRLAEGGDKVAQNDLGISYLWGRGASGVLARGGAGPNESSGACVG